MAKKIKVQIKTGQLPAFAGFVKGSAIKGRIKIIVDTENNILCCAEHDIDFYELLTENTVHEMLHVFQELYKKAFDEDQVHYAIEQGKKFLEGKNEHTEDR